VSTLEPLASMTASKTAVDPYIPDQAAIKHEGGDDQIDMIREGWPAGLRGVGARELEAVTNMHPTRMAFGGLYDE